MKTIPFALVLSAAAALPSQSQQVAYPDATLGTPAISFPFYTPGGGATGATVRAQFLVPHSFAALPQQPMFVSRIGLQLSGDGTYTRFELRAGSSRVRGLTSTWAQNLPDQRLQSDLGGVKIEGGRPDAQGKRQVAWVDFELNHPFVYTPGDDIVVDIITRLPMGGSYAYSGTDASVSRLVDFGYTGGASANGAASSGGMKVRLDFEPLNQVQTFGLGCAGTGQARPRIGSVGGAQIGSASFQITLQNALGGAANALVIGTRGAKGGTPGLPFDLGGGCQWLTSGEVLLFGTCTGTGAGQGSDSRLLPVLVPSTLKGLTVYAQWAVADPQGGSFTGLVLSDAAAVVLY